VNGNLLFVVAGSAIPHRGSATSSSHGQPSGPSHTSTGPDVGTSPSGSHFGVEPDKLDDEGHDLNRYQPGMSQQMNNWNRQHYNPDMYDDPDAPPPSP
jgi:hypothetical protein